MAVWHLSACVVSKSLKQANSEALPNLERRDSKEVGIWATGTVRQACLVGKATRLVASRAQMQLRSTSSSLSIVKAAGVNSNSGLGDGEGLAMANLTLCLCICRDSNNRS